MSEETTLVMAAEAKSSAESAHKRLDRMNGSIDRLGREVGDLRLEMQAARNESKNQADAIMARLDREQAGEQGQSTVRASILDTRWKFATVIATIAGSSVFAVFATFLVRRFG